MTLCLLYKLKNEPKFLFRLRPSQIMRPLVKIYSQIWPLKKKVWQPCFSFMQCYTDLTVACRMVWRKIWNVFFLLPLDLDYIQERQILREKNFPG